MKSPVEFTSYKTYLRTLIEESETRGLLSRLAEAADCQRPYLSKVLQRDSEVHLIPDHMFGICEYLQLTELESEYLKLLLERDRATQKRYRTEVEKKLAALKNQYTNLKKQIGKEQLPSENEPSNFYYSYWLYSALHIAVSIPELQTLPALVKKFSIPGETLEIYLRDLEKIGLVTSKNGRWVWESGDIHLSKDSFLIIPHHMNWRNQAIQNISLRQPDATHYSVVQSLSRSDYETLRLQMLDSIKKFQKIASPSEAEELVCFNLDFFRVGIT